jgi:hypothetical protein
MESEENGRSCEQVVTGAFIMTMRLPILHVLCKVFLAKHGITQVCQPP